jgi:hypothetical protein
MPEDDARRWLDLLWPKLQSRIAQMDLMNDFYLGDHPLPFLTKSHHDKIKSEFRRLLDESRSNFMRLVVDVVEERLAVEGFRLSATNEPKADEATWDIWQANQLDAEVPAALIDALVKGVSYLSVWEGEREDDYPSIAIEDPTETIVAYRGGSGYKIREAALKTWKDEWTGEQRANVYLPDAIYKFRAAKKGERAPGPTIAYTDGSEGSFSTVTLGGTTVKLSERFKRSSPDVRWVPLEDDDVVDNPVGIVPIVPLRNRGRVLCEGESELSDLFRIQSQINSLVFMQALAGYFGAHKQRWATGVQIARDDAGRPIEPFDAAIDRLWTAEDGEVKFGEFSATDLGGYGGAIEQRVLHIAVTSRTPRHYLIEQGQSPSGDAIKSAESGLVRKVERKQRSFGEGIEEALRLARRFAGEQDSPVDSEVVWSDAATRTEAEVTDAVIKQFEAGLIPKPEALRQLGYTQTEITRIMNEAQSDALLRALETPPEPPPEVAPEAGVTA